MNGDEVVMPLVTDREWHDYQRLQHMEERLQKLMAAIADDDCWSVNVTLLRDIVQGVMNRE